MTESEELGVLEAGMSVAAAVEGGVAVVHFTLTDPVGTFRVRRGADVMEAYTKEPEVARVQGDAVPWEWAELPGTGLEVKLLSAPRGGHDPRVWPVEDGPLKVGVRPAA